MKRWVIFIIVLCLSVFLVLAFAFIYYRDKSEYYPRYWLGFLNYRLNFRDLGESLNSCLQEDLFRTDLVYRSNKYFSGWGCEKIKNPDSIYSLNYSPGQPHNYFCYMESGGYKFGRHPNYDFEISDIENLEKWEDPKFRETMCIFFKETLADISEGKKILFHCDMGRDRTGTFSAMLSLLMAEQKDLPLSPIIDAIECDYEKTSSLEPFKKGRMKSFLTNLQESEGISAFLINTCRLDRLRVRQAAEKFIPGKDLPH